MLKVHYPQGPVSSGPRTLMGPCRKDPVRCRFLTYRPPYVDEPLPYLPPSVEGPVPPGSLTLAGHCLTGTLRYWAHTSRAPYVDGPVPSGIRTLTDPCIDVSFDAQTHPLGI